jgi:hypothetical protein
MSPYLSWNQPIKFLAVAVRNLLLADRREAFPHLADELQSCGWVSQSLDPPFFLSPGSASMPECFLEQLPHHLPRLFVGGFVVLHAF